MTSSDRAGHSHQRPRPSIRRLLQSALLGLLFASITPALADEALQVRHYAAFNEVQLDAQRSQATIDGRTLTLILQDNSDVLGETPPNTGNVQLQRGQLEGRPASWVRLTRSSQGVNGLIWDGRELYVVSSGTEARAASSTTPVIYRLSDAQTGLPADYCGAATAPDAPQTVDGLTAYKAVVHELATTNSADNIATGDATLRLELEVLADAAYRARFNSDEEALAALMTRLNNVDGIFRSQLGLAVSATRVQIFQNDPVLLSDSHDAGALLSALAQLRSSSAVMGTYAATHLVTGRDLDGDTLGISYIGQICGARYGVSLSEVRDRGVWIDSLVMAHELGHQLGAVHDGTGSCGNTDSEAYLMSATINGSSDFSDCSKHTILSTMSYAACLVPTDLPVDTSTADAAPQTTSGNHQGGGAFTLASLLCLLALAAMRQRNLNLMNGHNATLQND